VPSLSALAAAEGLIRPRTLATAQLACVLCMTENRTEGSPTESNRQARWIAWWTFWYPSE